MNIITTIIEKVDVQWEVQDDTYPYMDTFNFTKEEYEALSPEELLKMQEDKYNTWKEFIING